MHLSVLHIKRNVPLIFFSAKATASAAKTVTAAKPKTQKAPLKRQFSTLSMHSHRLSLAGGSDAGSDAGLEEHEKPYDAPMSRILGLNKTEWPFNFIGWYFVSFLS